MVFDATIGGMSPLEDWWLAFYSTPMGNTSTVLGFFGSLFGLFCLLGPAMADANTDEIVGLNIGGVHYLTTRSTLLGKNLATQTKNFFHGLLSGKFKTLKDSKNNFFIDRNGRLFEPILDFLRTGEWSIPPHLEATKVHAECEYYLMQDIPGLRYSLVGPMFSDLEFASMMSDAKAAEEEERYTTGKKKYEAFLSLLTKELMKSFRNQAQRGVRPVFPRDYQYGMTTTECFKYNQNIRTQSEFDLAPPQAQVLVEKRLPDFEVLAFFVEYAKREFQTSLRLRLFSLVSWIPTEIPMVSQETIRLNLRAVDVIYLKNQPHSPNQMTRISVLIEWDGGR